MTAPNPKRARHIRVLSHQDLSPNLRRIVFHSPDLADYPFVCNGAHIKLLLPLPGQEVPVLPEATPQGPKWADKSTRPIGRTYTLRGYDRDACTISVDFVLHSDAGPAADFARNAAAGQTLGVSAPAGPSPMLKPAARYLFAGDLSALPAIGSMIEDMPATAAGDVLLWLPEKADLPALPLPEAVRLHTFFGGMPQRPPRLVAARRPLLRRPLLAPRRKRRVLPQQTPRLFGQRRLNFQAACHLAGSLKRQTRKAALYIPPCLRGT